MSKHVRNWTCIVTTAPRSKCTLKLTCESLVDCGWTPIIFAEPGSTDLSNQYQTFWNDKRLGIWWNWMQASKWALSQETEYIITVQDDVDFHPETKDWLDRLDWPSNTGFISPYTPRPYQTWKNGTPRPPGLNPVKMRSCWTAQSLCFKHSVLKAVTDHPKSQTWVGLPPMKQRNPNGRIAHRAFKEANPHLIQNSDYIIGAILQRDLGLTLYYPNPSLATHCNPVSSVNHGSNTGRRNALYVAKFDLPIENQLAEEIELQKPIKKLTIEPPEIKNLNWSVDQTKWLQRFTGDRGPIHFLITREDLAKDTRYLTELIYHRHPNIKGIAGVARSGMLPATQIALDLGVDLYEATTSSINLISGGVRRTGTLHGNRKQNEGDIIIVDDSTCSGHAYKQLKHHGLPFYTIYGGHTGKDLIDGYVVPLELPHLFDWNLFHNGIIFRDMNAGFDMDGVFCEDCPIEYDDDGDKYIQWMKTVRPINYSIEYKIKHIITARREPYRQHTLSWLTRHGIEVENLVMFPGTFAERSKTNIGHWKAEQAKRLGCHLFVESSYQQCLDFITIHSKCCVVSMEKPKCFGHQT